MAKDDAGSAVETPPAKGADAGAPAAKPDAGTPAKEAAPKSSGNKWTDMMDQDIPALGKSKVGELAGDDEKLEADKGKAEKPAKGKPAKAADAGEDEEPEEKGKKPPAEAEDEDEEQEEDKGKKGEEDEDEQPEKGAGRYTVVAGDGSEFEFEALPKGAKIVFKAGGKKVEVTSLDDLVGLAQQVPGLRQMESSYQGKLKATSKQVTALTARLTAADQAFREILEDDEKLEAYRARAAKLKDPEYRDGLEAKRKLAQKEEAESEEGEVVLQQVTDEFWGEAKNQFETKLPDFPALDAEDYPDVVRTFWGNFTEHRNELLQQALAEAGTEELSKAQLEEVDEDAIAWLTEDNFEAAMKALHTKLERRSGRTGGGNGRRKAATQEEADAAEADRHNKHVDDKLRQRDTRTLKGKGAPPGRGGERETRPTTWADHMSGIHEEFDKAKKPAVTE